jgi:hypothetical protein
MEDLLIAILQGLFISPWHSPLISLQGYSSLAVSGLRAAEALETADMAVAQLLSPHCQVMQVHCGRSEKDISIVGATRC